MKYADALPIDPHLESIVHKIQNNLPVILSASPGSGKTTRVPAALLHSLIQQKKSQKIVVILPKRISVLSAASRVGEENQWSLGHEVGYMVRFESQVSANTQLIFMTDGLFLKKLNDPAFMKSVGFIFLDEFHERKSNMDVILGLAFEQKVLHNNLQIVVMSATMNIEQLKNYFNPAETIEIQAPPYKLETVYLNTNQRLVCDNTFYEHLKETAVTAWNKARKDILVFLPGMREINRASEILRARFPQVAIDVLHGSLSLAAQKKIVIKAHAERRFILATNIAESSITIPGLDAVIDSGLEKNISFERKIGFSKLKTERISQFSAIQRQGRAARTQDGFCFKLWHPVDERSMPATIQPEILNTPLHAELLLLAATGINDFEQFSWLSSPPKLQVQNSIKDLKKWKLIDDHQKITALGRLVIQSPVNIMNSIVLIELLNHPSLTPAFVCDLVSRCEDFENSTMTSSSATADDIQRLMEQPSTATQSKLKDSLLQFCKKASLQSDLVFEKNDSVAVTLFKIFSHYFPQRIIAKKTGNQGLSSSGRGVELSPSSGAQNSDFYIALAGEEKSDATTLIQYAVGINKTDALKILSAEARYENNVFFDESNETFYQQETLFYGSFKLNEKSKQKLNTEDLNHAWKKYITESPEIFLKLNPNYQKILILVQFLNTKKQQLKLNENDFIFLENLNQDLAQKLVQTIETFEDFKNTEIIYYLSDLMPEQVYNLLQQLPKSLKLPSGRHAEIDYQDPKAPLVSSKIQDFFGWTTTPQLFEGMNYTLELLAPNRRPAQTTSDLAYFWKNSYLDVRKDLRARYPKHSWPEDPTKI